MNKISWWIKNGGWIAISVIGGFGILMAAAGMFMTLIDIYHNCDLGAFIGCTIIGVLVLSTAGVGIYGIVTIIKKHKDLFKW